MANCYLCSLYLPKGEGIRVECSTGSRQGKSRGFSLFSGRDYSSTSYALRTLCPGCAIRQQSANESARKRQVVFFCVFVLVLVVFGLCLITPHIVK